MNKSRSQSSQDWRKRKLGQLPPLPICVVCGRQLKGIKSKQRLTCSKCWDNGVTPQARKYQTERMRKLNAKKKYSNESV